MNIFIFISALINGITAVTTGTLVYLKNKHKLLNQAFAVFCFAIAFWAFGSFWPITSDRPELALSSFRILHVGAFFLAIANFHFICALLGTIKQELRLIKIGYFFSVVLLPLIGTKLFITDIIPHDTFGLWFQPGDLYHIWIAIWLAYFARAFHLLGVFQQRSKGIKKQQIKYIYLGEVVSFLTLVMNFLPTYGFSVPVYFNILLAGQISTFAYAILRYRYLNIQISAFSIFKRIITLLVAISIGLGVSAPFFSHEIETSALVLFSVISLATYFSLAAFLESRVLYHLLGIQHIDDLTQAIDTFYKKQLFYTDLSELRNSVQDIFVTDLGISSAEIVLLDDVQQKDFEILSQYFKKSRAEYLLFEEFLPTKKEKDCDRLRSLGSLCFPLRGAKENIVGFFFLGHKPRKHSYTQAELAILTAAANHISLSLKILNYNADLQHEVARKTKQLKRSYQKLKQKDIEKDSFFSMTSHDLRTPLTIIKGYDDFLLSEKFGTLNTKQKNFVERAQKSTEDMLWLVNSLLDISKLDAGKMDFKLEKIDLLSFLKDIVEDFRVRCAEKSILLHFEHPQKSRMRLSTDPEKFKRVIINLLGNAFKFTPESGLITLRVKACADNKNCIRLEVEDNGIGIAKKSQKSIFEAFSQVQDFNNKGGTGLGLSIVKKIVERLGGKIWVESEVGKGATFIFTTPITSNIKPN